MKNTLLRRLGCLGCIFTAILLFSHFGSLQAQEAAKNQSRKTGWFAGSSYRLSPVELEITQGTREVTFTDTKVDTRTEETVDVAIKPNNISTRYEIEIASSSDIKKTSNAALTDDDNDYFKELGEKYCRTGAISGFAPPTNPGVTADPYPDEKWIGRTGGLNQISAQLGCAIPEVTSGNFSTYFPNTTPNSLPPTTYSSSSSRIINNSTGADIQATSNKIGGQNIYFGYNFEKFRVTFSDSRWNSGAAKIQSQMVFADWFLPRNLYAGFGIARSHLATSFGSDSSIKPVITFGKRRRISQRLTVEIGFLYQQVELSVSNNSNNKPNNISLGTPSVGAEIAGEQRTNTTSRTGTLPDTLQNTEIRTKHVEAHQAVIDNNCVGITGNCPDNPAKEIFIVPLGETVFKRVGNVGPEIGFKATRIVTITGEQAEFITTTTTQEFKTTTTTEGTATQTQNEAKVTIPSTVFINIHLSF